MIDNLAYINPLSLAGWLAWFGLAGLLFLAWMNWRSHQPAWNPGAWWMLAALAVLTPLAAMFLGLEIRDTPALPVPGLPENPSPDCTMSQYLQIVSDFNEQWAKDYGYKAEVLVPLQSRDMATIYWVGRSKNAEAFGKGLDAWRAAQADPNSTAAKLMARLRTCTTTDSRAGFASH